MHYIKIIRYIDIRSLIFDKYGLKEMLKQNFRLFYYLFSFEITLIDVESIFQKPIDRITSIFQEIDISVHPFSFL